MSGGIWLFALALLVIIMIHESGHFIAAKLFDFKATKFFIGFGPTLWSFKRGETEYGVKAIPAGGFVKIIGMNPYEDVPPEDRSRAYPNKPKWQRVLVILGGPLTHWPLAFALLMIAALTIGYPSGEQSTEIIEVQSRIQGEREETPAGEAELRPGDRIVGVGGADSPTWDEVSRYIKARPNEEATFSVLRDGERREVSVRLAEVIFSKKGEVLDYASPGDTLRPLKPGETRAGFLGITPKERYERLGPVEAVGRSGEFLWFYTSESFKGMGAVLAQPFNGELWDALRAKGKRTGDDGPIGIVGISRIAGQIFEEGQLLIYIHFLVQLTIFIGLINLLPLPPLDGGHLAVLLYEAVTRRTMDMRKLIPVAAAVLSFFIVMFLAALYLDIARPLDSPF